MLVRAVQVFALDTGDDWECGKEGGFVKTSYAEMQHNHSVMTRELRMYRRLLRDQVRVDAESFEDIETTVDVLQLLLESSGKMEPAISKCIEKIKQSCI
jgi:uncharacterized protein with von Willebrand factor type A (vWA) domain